MTEAENIMNTVNNKVQETVSAFSKNDASTNIAICVGAAVAVFVMPSIMAIFGGAVAAKKVAEMVGNSTVPAEPENK